MKNFKVIFVMNNPCFNYFKNRNPIKFISNIFRNYKKSSDGEGSIKRNQSEPAVAHQKMSSDDVNVDKQKSERNLSVAPKNNAVTSSDSRESLKLTWSNSKFGRSSSHISLKQKCSYIDLNIREKLESMPVPESFGGPEVSAKSYPWQNFNIDSVQTSRFDPVKAVDNLTHEFLSVKKSILKRPEDAKSPAGQSPIPSKEVKFNKTASMIIYPKINTSVMRQSKFNLSTANKGNILGKRKVDEGFSEDRDRVRPDCYRKTYWKHNDRKLINEEQGYLWYMNKKQKTY